ncbi:MAG TPA: hypothetical protein VGC76_10445 [Pyrinomonadaceae bacterium]|jgi:hypothetical protein
MELFQQLGAEIENLWRDKDYDENLFPEIAANSLRAARMHEKISAWQIIEWTLQETNLPVQQDVSGKFGDPPITLYNSPRFHIDVYFWLEGTTAIHQHAFCGAFQVLHGSSLHSWYDFERSESVNTFTEIGSINLKLCELLTVGDVQPIWAGKQYIHGLFHLEQPSATIVVRTHKSPMFLPQYSYHKPFLAIDPFFEEPNTLKKLQSITTLIRSKHPDTDKFIAGLLEKSDFQTSFQILSTARAYLQSNQVDQLFNLGAGQNRFEALLDVVKKRHGERANIFPKVFAHQAKVDEIVKRRSYISEPEHRFFLALLMNVEGKERIFSLIKQRFPDDEPIEKILDWTFDLAQTRVLGLNIPNALGIADFGDLDLFILESLLKDTPDKTAEQNLESEYGMKITDEVRENLQKKREQIRQSVIFGPLMQ